MQNLEQIIDSCYAGYTALEDNPMPKEEWVKTATGKQFINKMRRIQKMRKV